MPAWIENSLELLDQPGEWFADFQARRVYYMPLPTDNFTSSTTGILGGLGHTNGGMIKVG